MECLEETTVQEVQNQRKYGATKKIFGMRMVTKYSKLKLNQKKYLEKVLEKFNLSNLRKTDLPLCDGFSLTKAQSLVTKHEQREIPICISIWKFYVCHDHHKTRHFSCMGIVSRFISKPGTGGMLYGF